MRVTVNGQPMALPDGLTVAGLLEHLGIPREHTAVALNREVVARAAHVETALREGDRIEIVRPMGGG